VDSYATLRIGELIRQARYEQNLTVKEVAAKAEVSHTMISRLEHHRTGVTVATAERIFLALGLRLHVEALPAWANVDTAIAEAAKRSLQERIAGWPTDITALIRRFDGLPYLIGGLASAALQGAPVLVDEVDILVLNDDETLARLPSLLGGLRATRGNGWEPLDPRQQGSDRYRSLWGKFRLRLIDSYQPALWIDIDPLPEGVLPYFRTDMTRARVALVPLEEIKTTDAYARQVLDRMSLPRT
jgi:transcriptional regulator with XRE-family HTH domain